jgi:hypothetical protein
LDITLDPYLSETQGFQFRVLTEELRHIRPTDIPREAFLFRDVSKSLSVDLEFLKVLRIQRIVRHEIVVSLTNEIVSLISDCLSYRRIIRFRILNNLIPTVYLLNTTVTSGVTPYGGFRGVDTSKLLIDVEIHLRIP